MKNDTSITTIPTSEYESLKAENAELARKIEWLTEQFRLSRHRQFGASSEKSEYDQLSIFNEAEATADVNVVDPALTEIKRHFRKRKRLVNDCLSDNLPVETVEHDLPLEEQICP